MKEKLFKILHFGILPFLLISWCVGHYFLQPIFQFSPWYGGGFAMFSSLDKGDSTRAIRVWRRSKKGAMKKLNYRDTPEVNQLLLLPSEENGRKFLETQRFKKDKTYLIEIFQFNYSNTTKKMQPIKIKRLRLVK